MNQGTLQIERMTFEEIKVRVFYLYVAGRSQELWAHLCLDATSCFRETLAQRVFVVGRCECYA
jgi:hypothetical protein